MGEDLEVVDVSFWRTTDLLEDRRVLLHFSEAISIVRAQQTRSLFSGSHGREHKATSNQPLLRDLFMSRKTKNPRDFLNTHPEREKIPRGFTRLWPRGID